MMMKAVWARRIEIMTRWMIGEIEDDITVTLYKIDEEKVCELRYLYLEHVVFLRKHLIELDALVQRCRVKV